jgi:hypothetical protein
MFRFLGVSALLAFLLSVASVCSAADKKAPNKGKAKPQLAKPALVQQIGLAASLTEYGRQAKSPTALLAAAEILHKTGYRPAKMKGDKVENRAPERPAGLAREALKWSKTDAEKQLANQVMDSVADIPKPRLPYPMYGVTVLKGGGIFEHTLVGQCNVYAMCDPQYSMKVRVIDAKTGQPVSGEYVGFDIAASFDVGPVPRQCIVKVEPAMGIGFVVRWSVP